MSRHAQLVIVTFCLFASVLGQQETYLSVSNWTATTNSGDAILVNNGGSVTILSHTQLVRRRKPKKKNQRETDFFFIHRFVFPVHIFVFRVQKFFFYSTQEKFIGVATYYLFRVFLAWNRIQGLYLTLFLFCRLSLMRLSLQVLVLSYSRRPLMCAKILT
jgi:hypothetical protein